MPEEFQISKEEVNQMVVDQIPPKGFRFAKVSDFLQDGKRIDQLVIFIHGGNTIKEYYFNEASPRNWIQWKLINGQILIKTGNRKGKKVLFTTFIIPTEEFLKNELC